MNKIITRVADRYLVATRIAERYLGSGKVGAWDSLPKGWTQKSLQQMWKSLTGDSKHKVSACIRKMDGKIDDPGAFCASLADQIEGKGWRSE